MIVRLGRTRGKLRVVHFFSLVIATITSLTAGGQDMQAKWDLDRIVQCPLVDGDTISCLNFEGRGIVMHPTQRDVWKAVRIIHSVPSRYPNELYDDEVIYCLPRGATIRSAASTLTANSKASVLVYIMHGPRTYAWGTARFDGKYTDEQDGVVRVRLVRAETTEETPIGTDETKELKRPRLTYECTHLNTVWGSRGEAATANLFFLLGFQLGAAPTFSADALGFTKAYTPDIYIVGIRVLGMQRGDATVNLIVERKPDAKVDAHVIQRCANLSTSYGCVVMIISGDVTVPYDDNGQSVGLRGMLFEPNADYSGNWVLMKEIGSEMPFLRRLVTIEERRHLHPHLAWAYARAYDL